MKRLLFIGTVYPKILMDKYSKQGVNIEFASHTFQKALLAGFAENGYEVDVISAPPIPSYPKGPLYYRGLSINENDIHGKTINFLNIPLVKLLSKFINLSYNLRKEVKGDKYVVIYETTSWQLFATAIFLRDMKKYVVVPDLPEYMSANKNPLYLLLKSLDRLLINIALKYMDGFVLLSEPMAEKLNVKEKPYTIVEGVYHSHKVIGSEPVARLNKKIALYTGKIEERFGLKDLLEAFEKIDGDEYQLWICGGGDLNLINNYSQKDERIKFWGIVPRDEVLAMQKEVNLLVNPRHSNEDFTKYSFPSKTMEYMASGTPTLMCKLPSIPTEYHQYLFFFEDESVEGMSIMMKKLLDQPCDKMRDFGKRASEFIVGNKNSRLQTKKILDMIIDDNKDL